MQRFFRTTKRLYWQAAFLLLIFSAVATHKSYATTDPVVVTVLKGNENQIKKDSARETFDPVFYSPNKASIADTTKDLYRNMIALLIDEEAQVAIGSNFTATVWVKIFWTSVSGVQDSITKILEVNYDTAAATQYGARNYFYFDQARRVTMRVDSVDQHGAGWDITQVLMLENRMEVTRDYAFQCTESVNSIDHEIGDITGEGKFDELIVNWTSTAFRGITHFDLEWAWIDYDALNRYKNEAGYFNDTLIFRNNSSRVTISVSSTSYKIPLIYDGSGYLFYRVRPVHYAENGDVVEGIWSGEYDEDFTSFYAYTSGHEPGLNWQVSTTYAEDGKRKTVIQYFDGTLRSRQTVTKDNVNNNLVVAETLYDYQGRAAINILPAPTLGTVIQYATNFNRFIGAAGDPKDKYDLVPIGQTICTTNTPGLDNNYGSSKYYSPNNPDVNTGFNKYIPDAENYSYAETRYVPDATGRVAAQGGVGPAHQLGSGHETKYFYGAASQRELNALFGTEVGDATHYAKNMVRDANGQYSVSYVDMYGRTVATALAGVPPANLKALDSYQPDTMTRNLLTPANNIVKGRSIESSTTLLVTKEGPHTFHYELSPQSLELAACNPEGQTVCYDCYYDLEIRITGTCGQEPIVITRKNFTFGEYDTECENAPPSLVVDEMYTLTEGEYNITKKLTLSQDAQTWYRENIFREKNICKTLEEFYNTILAALQEESNCNISCETCTVAIGEYADYRAQFLESQGIDPGTTVSYEQDIQAAYEEAFNSCKLLCEEVPVRLNSIRQQMLEDMIPGTGQYGRLTVAGNSSPLGIFAASPQTGLIPFRNPYKEDSGPSGIFFPGLDNQYTETTNPSLDVITEDEFSSQFGANWANALIYYHPEYCKLKTAETELAESYAWDEKLENVQTWAEAETKGFLNTSDLLDDDPFFSNPANSAARSFMQAQITTAYRATGKSMWQMAMISVFCLDRNDNACVNSFAATPPYTVGEDCSGDWNNVWRSFRSLYLSVKDSVINSYLDNACDLSEQYAIIDNVDNNYQRRFGNFRNLAGNTDFSAVLAALEGISGGTRDYHEAGEEYSGPQMEQQYRDNCAGYIEGWKARLLTCDQLYNHADREQILKTITKGMEDVCYRGSDEDHIFGSSTVKPSDNLSPRSFEEVIAGVFSTYGISTSSFCHPYLIDFPKPYDRQQVLSDITVFEQKDTCVCTRLQELEQEKARLNFVGTLSNFLLKEHGVEVRQSFLDSLSTGCDTTGIFASCVTWDPPVVVPAILSCSAPAKTCIDCDLYKEMKEDFLELYPSYPVIYDMPANEEENDKNVMFEKFMNSRSGLSKSWLDYLEFEKACESDSITWNCKMLRNVVNAFYAEYPSIDSVETEDCRSLFVAFFNDYFDTDYDTFAEVQNIYLATCGYLPDVCEPRFTCDSFTNLINSFYQSKGDTVRTALDCKEQFVAYFNLTYGTDYDWPTIASMAQELCGYPLNVCSRYTLSWLNQILDSWYGCQNNYWMEENCESLWVTYFNAATGDSLTYREIYLLYLRYGITINPCSPRIDVSTLQNLLATYNNNNAQICAGITDCSTCFTGFINETLGLSLAYEQIVLLYKRNTGTAPGICKEFFQAFDLLNLSSDFIKNNAGFTGNCDSLFTAAFNDKYDLDYNFSQIMAVYELYTGTKPEVCSKKTLLSGAQLDGIRQRFIRLYPDPVNYFGDTAYKDAFAGFFNQSVGDTLSYHDIWLYYGTLSGIELDFASDSLACERLTEFKNEYLEKYAEINIPQVLCHDLFTHEFNKAFAPRQPYTWAEIAAQYANCGDTLNICPSDPPGTLLACYKLADAKKAIRALYDNKLPANCEQIFTGLFNYYYETSFADYQQLMNWASDNCGTDYDLCGILPEKKTIYLRTQPAALPPVNWPRRLCSSLPLFPTLIVDEEDPCAYEQTLALHAATEQYNAYVQNQVDDFDKKYQDKCLAAASLEKFTVTSEVAEYHYTLYYYDQAGNLVKTVPPAGVNPNFSWAFHTDVEAARAIGHTATPVIPSHTLNTDYRYNTLNQVVSQKSPDGGISHFWYDELGRLVVSQNAKQAVTDKYSYTLYDILGRITEVGQLESDEAMTQAIAQNKADLTDWIADANSTKEQITTTLYDVKDETLSGYLDQENLRNRVSYTKYIDAIADGPADFTGTYYSYDIHGNVDTLVQYYGKGVMDETGNALKRIIYQYDLISGKVNEVAYQPGIKDQFFHRYDYDAENKLTDVWTSHDKVYWEKQAAYSYYKHGPLARTELGQLGVQGIDYAYTLQGWLKGVNTTAVTADGEAGSGFDIGLDGAYGARVAKDAYGFSLNYYKSYVDANSTDHTDYKAINSGVLPFAAISNSLPQISSDGVNTGEDLFNGNIRAMLVNIPKLTTTGALEGVKLYGYQYDQLNRITAMNAYNGLDIVYNTFTATETADYKERISYDPNGNIMSYVRNGTTATGNPLKMDNLVYHYYSGTNQLNYVDDDAIISGNYSIDIDDQDTYNYTYDEIGNLVSDVAEGISSIEWTVYGKISSITKTNGTIIEYRYDASGNRIEKKVDPAAGATKITAYVRDASGNVMAVYEKGEAAMTQTEVHIYGSSRIGLWRAGRPADFTVIEPEIPVTMPGTGGGYTEQFVRGRTVYELSNHLGNVLVTVSDRKLAVPICGRDGCFVDYYKPDVLSANDYYPFGMQMPERSFSAGDAYRYGFNGKENDNEVKGEGNQQDYGMRIYDPRLGKFLSVDPLMMDYPWFTPYQFSGNMPVWAVDIDGMEGDKKPNANENNSASDESETDVHLQKAGDYFDLTFQGNARKNYLNQYSLTNAANEKVKEIVELKEKKSKVFSDLRELDGALNSTSASFLNELTEIDKQIESKTKSFSFLTVQIYKAMKETDNVEAYNKWLGNALEMLNYGTNAMVVAATFLPSGGTSAGFFSVGSRFPLGMTFKQASGGVKQWIRFGSSFSKTTQTTTFGLRWGAGANFARTIGSTRLQLSNISLRSKYLMPWLKSGWNEAGHLHLLNTSILSKPQWGNLSLHNVLKLVK